MGDEGTAGALALPVPPIPRSAPSGSLLLGRESATPQPRKGKIERLNVSQELTYPGVNVSQELKVQRLNLSQELT